MSQQVLEGSWEEIVEHADELSGKRVRLMVIDESPVESGHDLSAEERPLSELLSELPKVL